MGMIDSMGAYNYRSFRSTEKEKKKIIWTLTGTENDGSRPKIGIDIPQNMTATVLRSIDTFVNQKGQLLKRFRWQVYDALQKEQIEPVPESLIIASSKSTGTKKRAV